MTWLLPGFLAGSLLVALPIALHLLRSRPKLEIRFPTLRFLAESAVRDTTKHRLRRWITLALRMLVITLLAAAFARPFWKHASDVGKGAMIVAVDNSMSMQADGRWERLREWARGELDGLEPGDQAGILVMHPSPRWLAPLTDDLAAVRGMLSKLEPGYEATRYAAALGMAGETLAALPATRKTLVWMADEQRLGWLGTSFGKQLPPGVKVVFGEPAASPGRQAAIVAARWVNGADGRGIEVVLRGYAPDEDERRLAVVAGGATLVEQNVLLRAGEETTVQIPLPRAAAPDAAGIRVTLDPDALPADDTAWLTAAPHAATVLRGTATGATDFIAHALEATKKLPAAPLDAEPLPAGEWPPTAVVILQGGNEFSGPARSRLDAFAATGGQLLIFVDGSADQRRWLEERGITVTDRGPASNPWHLRDWDGEHPVVKALGDEGLGMLELMDVEFTRGCDLAGETLVPMARWPDGRTAIAEADSRGAKLVLCGFPPTRSAANWVASPSFVPFVHRVVSHLAAAYANKRDWRVGDTIPLPAGEGTWRSVDAPRPTAARKAGGGIRPDAPGLYQFSTGTGSTLYAVNTPPAESDLSPWPDPDQLSSLQSPAEAEPAEAVAGAGPPLSNEVAESQQRLWWWLLALCSAVLVVELSLANRTAA